MLFGIILFDSINLILIKNNDNTDIDDQIYWRIELKPTHEVILIEAYWPVEELLAID